MIHDARKIIPGLVVFVGLVTFPVWYNAAQGAERSAASLARPSIEALPGERCVEPAEYMRTSHMRLLGTWQQQVVRQGNRSYIASDGQPYVVSLEETCLGCHADDRPPGNSVRPGAGPSTPAKGDDGLFQEPEFCAECHRYANVRTDCWNCHVGVREDGS